MPLSPCTWVYMSVLIKSWSSDGASVWQHYISRSLSVQLALDERFHIASKRTHFSRQFLIDQKKFAAKFSIANNWRHVFLSGETFVNFCFFFCKLTTNRRISIIASEILLSHSSIIVLKHLTFIMQNVLKRSAFKSYFDFTKCSNCFPTNMCARVTSSSKRRM